MPFHFGCPLTGVCVGVETGVCEGGRKLSSPLTRVSVESFHSMKIINHIQGHTSLHSHIKGHQVNGQSHSRTTFFTINKSHYALHHFDVAPSAC